MKLKKVLEFIDSSQSRVIACSKDNITIACNLKCTNCPACNIKVWPNKCSLSLTKKYKSTTKINQSMIPQVYEYITINYPELLL